MKFRIKLGISRIILLLEIIFFAFVFLWADSFLAFLTCISLIIYLIAVTIYSLNSNIILIQVFLKSSILAIIINIYFFEIAKVTSLSMESTLLEGDIVLINKLIPGPRIYKKRSNIFLHKKGIRDIRFEDVIVFYHPRGGKNLNQVKPSPQMRKMVKRVLGTPSDTIYMEDGILFKNNTIKNFPESTKFLYDIELNKEKTIHDYKDMSITSVSNLLVDSIRNIWRANLNSSEVKIIANLQGVKGISRYIDTTYQSREFYFNSKWNKDNINKICIPKKGDKYDKKNTLHQKLFSRYELVNIKKKPAL